MGAFSLQIKENKMPRNGSGVYALPGGSTVTNGDTSDATDVNTPLADIATDLNTARPVVAGGTGAATAAAARTNLAVGISLDTDVSAELSLVGYAQCSNGQSGTFATSQLDGFSSASRTGTGVYEYTFDTARADTSYFAFATPHAANTSRRATVQKTTSVVTVSITDDTDTAADAVHSLIVFEV